MTPARDTNCPTCGSVVRELVGADGKAGYLPAPRKGLHVTPDGELPADFDITEQAPTGLPAPEPLVGQIFVANRMREIAEAKAELWSRHFGLMVEREIKLIRERDDARHQARKADTDRDILARFIETRVAGSQVARRDDEHWFVIT